MTWGESKNERFPYSAANVDVLMKCLKYFSTNFTGEILCGEKWSPIYVDLAQD